jgi:hypothetical protein
MLLSKPLQNRLPTKAKRDSCLCYCCLAILSKEVVKYMLQLVVVKTKNGKWNDFISKLAEAALAL